MVLGPVWLEYQPSHRGEDQDELYLGEAICHRKNQNLDQNLLGRAEKLTPVRPITDTKYKLPEVGSNTSHGAKNWDGMGME